MIMTTDFQNWLSNVDSEDHEEIYSLYHAVRDGIELGNFNVVLGKGAEQWIVTGLHIDSGLLLASVQARNALLSYLEREYCGDLDMEGWHSHEQAVAKED